MKREQKTIMVVGFLRTSLVGEESIRQSSPLGSPNILASSADSYGLRTSRIKSNGNLPLLSLIVLSAPRMSRKRTGRVESIWSTDLTA